MSFFHEAANPATVAQTYDYGYGRPAPAASYDATKTYYQQPAAAAVTYTSTETHYQAAKPAYSTTSAYTGTARQATTTGQAKTYQAPCTAYQQSNPAQNATYSSGYTAPATPAAPASAASNSKCTLSILFVFPTQGANMNGKSISMIQCLVQIQCLIFTVICFGIMSHLYDFRNCV